ncbi:MAG: hypothetical protein J0L75_01570 [Spirochaetes bacterium]|nr:hypothetical protein [Spirochaetota bacterium]
MKFRSAAALLPLFLWIQGLAAVSMTPAELFNALQQAADRNTPEHLRCRIVSPLVDAQIRQIPRDKIEFNAVPYAELLFKKGVGFRLMVRHVDDYYVRKLGIFEDILEQSGLFVGVGRRNTWALFSRAWEISELPEEGGLRRIKVRERDGLPGDYGIYYLSADWTLQKSEFFEGNQIRATLALSWQKLGEVSVVSTLALSVREDKRLTNLSVRFTDFKFDPLNAAEFRGR